MYIMCYCLLDTLCVLRDILSRVIFMIFSLSVSHLCRLTPHAASDFKLFSRVGGGQ